MIFIVDNKFNMTIFYTMYKLILYNFKCFIAFDKTHIPPPFPNFQSYKVTVQFKFIAKPRLLNTNYTWFIMRIINLMFQFISV